jgi:hypothetical protein
MNKSSSSLLKLQSCVGLGLLHPLWTFRNSRFFYSEVCLHHAQLSTWRTRVYTLSDPYPWACLAWVALPGAHAPISIVLRVTWARKTPLHNNTNK